MRKQILLISFCLTFVFSSCIQKNFNVDEESMSNQQRMQLLKIDDPSVWNTLTKQSIDLNELDASALKSAAAIQEYPKGGNYYFALYEDLYPAEGDYDFNDVIIKSIIGMQKSGKTISGYVKSSLVNRGGSKPVNVGLMFYEVTGISYTRIDNENITVNGQQLKAGEDPWQVPLTELDDSWQIDFSFTNSGNNVWISYFIYTNDEIFTGGFAPSKIKKFNIPQSDFLTTRNLPWGLEIEATDFAIPNEKEFFLNAYPEFKDWAESGGVKNKKWFEAPNSKYTHK